MLNCITITSGVVCAARGRSQPTDLFQLFAVESSLSDLELNEIITKVLLQYMIDNASFIKLDKSYNPKTAYPEYYTGIILYSDFIAGFVKYFDNNCKYPLWISRNDLDRDNMDDVWVSNEKDIYLRLISAKRSV